MADAQASGACGGNPVEVRVLSSAIIMDKKDAETIPKTSPKSFLAAGPTLHYSHENVQRCWILALLLYGITCGIWSKLLSGSFWLFDWQNLISLERWCLGEGVINGISIFEYPSQILVLGILMGILAVVPVLISQLMSFRYSLLFIITVAVFANLPGLAVSLIISCIAVACRPLRFRSRFISIALCMAPQLLYWGYFGGARGIEPIKWGFSFTPWICAWLAALLMAGIVLGIGHFTRYRPGLIWIFTFLQLALAVVIFEFTVSFDELDYQLYIAKNNPELIEQLQDRSITESLDQTVRNPAVIKYLSGFFYPTEPIALRAELKREMQLRLRQDAWPNWFLIPSKLNYQPKKQALFQKYEFFITRRPQSRRMPIALYFKAFLSEYTPDVKLLGEKEILHFYSDYPYERSRPIWYKLYSEFGDCPESLEARWRIATHWARQKRFEQAEALLAEAQSMLSDTLIQEQAKVESKETFLSSPFRSPAETVITPLKLNELRRKIAQLRSLISKDNRTDNPGSITLLAEFIKLNPHEPDYQWQLESLLKKTADTDKLKDNILLAQAKLIADEQLRAEKLQHLHEKFQHTDGGIQALYELGLLKISLWQQNEVSPDKKKKYLFEAREVLKSFVDLYPNSFWAEQVNKNLANLPKTE